MPAICFEGVQRRDQLLCSVYFLRFEAAIAIITTIMTTTTPPITEVLIIISFDKTC